MSRQACEINDQTAFSVQSNLYLRYLHKLSITVMNRKGLTSLFSWAISPQNIFWNIDSNIYVSWENIDRDPDFNVV